MTLAIDTPATRTDELTAELAAAVFRVDKFIVPSASLPAFMARMKEIQQMVRALPGCRRDLLLQQTGGAGEFNVVRLIEWASTEAVTSALATMRQRFKDEGFDPTAFFVKQLGAKTDFGLYQVV
jgi:hypothetical protein